ncbi:MAG: ABC transporter permease subunit [Pirellulaceae bacterium]|nr:ABC transporter permease subunit [Pirellulaceae bacterium]
MPLHDVGYRGWIGTKSCRWTRWWVVALVGIQLAFRTSWLNRTLAFSWIPAIIIGVGFFAYEQSIVNPTLRTGIANLMILSSANRELAQTVVQNPEVVRHEVWSSLVLAFFRYPQAIMMLITVGIVAPKLISYDLRNRGYLLYFSRPLRVWEYMLGKSLVVWFFLALITTLPALCLYVVGVLLSPHLNVVGLTWDIPLRILAASCVLLLPTAAVALACSAMTIESRYAAFSWFSLWIVGWVSYSILSFGERMNRPEFQNLRPRRRDRWMDAEDFHSRWELLSPYHLLGRVQQWVFGMYPEDHEIWPYLLTLSSVTLVALWFVHRKLRSRLQA